MSNLNILQEIIEQVDNLNELENFEDRIKKELNEKSTEFASSLAVRGLLLTAVKKIDTRSKADLKSVNQALSVKAALAGSSSQDFQASNLLTTGNLTVTGKINGNSAELSHEVTVHGQLTVYKSQYITGNLIVNTDQHINGSLTVDGNQYLNGKLTVTGTETSSFTGSVAIGTETPENDYKLHVEGSQYLNGNLEVTGEIHGNSALYFMNKNHELKDKANKPGCAAIENAKNYKALMILGRKTTEGRKIELYDVVTVVGRLKVTGEGTGTSSFDGGVGIGINEPENGYKLHVEGSQYLNGNLNIEGQISASTVITSKFQIGGNKVNKITSDLNVDSSNETVPSAHAVKVYVDQAIGRLNAKHESLKSYYQRHKHGSGFGQEHTGVPHYD